jgi:protein-disulfide isomerase
MKIKISYIKKSKLLLFCFLLSLLSCKEVNVKTQGQTLSEQQIIYLEKRLELVEKKVLTIEEQIRDSQLNNPTESADITSEAINENVTYKLLESTLNDPIYSKDVNLKTKVIVVVFTDLLCRTCRTFINETLPKIKDWVNQHPESKLFLRDFPLSSELNEVSKKAAIASNCISEKSDYWSYISLMNNSPKDFENFLDLAGKLPEIDYESFKNCLYSDKYDKEISIDKNDAKELGVKGVPSIFVGKVKLGENFHGTLIRGNQPADTIISIFNKVTN